MKVKARFTLTATLEVELDTDLYDDSVLLDQNVVEPQAMLNYEVQEMSSDPDRFWEIYDSKGTGLTVKGELLP